MKESPSLIEFFIGRKPIRSVFVLGGAVGLSLSLSYLIKNRVISTMDTFIFLVLILNICVLLAALNAYWNDGFLASWAIVFALTYPIQPVVNTGEMFHVTATVLVGTPGYVLGWSIYRLGNDAWWKDSDSKDLPGLMEGDYLLTQDKIKEFVKSSRGRQFLLGRNAVRTTQWLLLAWALGTFVTGLLFTFDTPSLSTTGGFLELFYPTSALDNNVITGCLIILGWTVLASLPAYFGNGLLVSWAIIFIPQFAANLVYFGMATTVGVPSLVLFSAYAYALVFTLVLGSLGFLVGELSRTYVIPPNFKNGRRAGE